MQYIFKNKKFGIRKYRMSDAEFIVKNINDKAIAKNMPSIPQPYYLKDAKKWIARAIRSYKKNKTTELCFIIEVKGEAVGSIGLHEIIQGHKAEIGYWIGKKYRGQRIITQAIKEVSKYAFKKFKLKRIYAQVLIFNKGSRKVLEKNNFKLEGIIKKDTLKNKKYIDTCLYAKIK